MQRDFLKVPTTEAAWKRISEEFDYKWNFPHCLGAIDGKHIVIQAPNRRGSEFFIYKKTHSIVLLAVCNANYEFTLVDIGDAGRQSDGGVYTNSKLGYAISNDLLKIPNAECFPSSTNGKKYPYVFIGDDAFQLKPHLLKPYPGGGDGDEMKTIYNYRLSRARRVIENAFGIAAARFRIFRNPIIAKVETVTLVTKAVILLHNFLMKTQCHDDLYNYCPPGFVDTECNTRRIPGHWREDVHGTTGLLPLTGQGSNNYSRNSATVRDDFKVYLFSRKGAVPWHGDMVNSTTNYFDRT